MNSLSPQLARLYAAIDLPVIAAPMFLVTSVALVCAASRNGIMAALPSLNARSTGDFDRWMDEIASDRAQALARGERFAPWAVNLVSHGTNDRLQPDLEVCVKHRVPLVITALGSPARVVQAVRGYGGMVFADVSTPQYARKAADAGVDGLVLIASGAGGHTGPMAAPAFIEAVRKFWDGIIVVGGGLGTGQAVRAVQCMGADFAYMGTRFIATHESHAAPRYKEMVVQSEFEDIICTNAITGAWANKLRPSLIEAGLDPDNLRPYGSVDFSDPQTKIKAWKDLWSAGHGVGQISAIQSVAQIVAQLREEYFAAVRGGHHDYWSARLAQSAGSEQADRP